MLAPLRFLPVAVVSLALAAPPALAGNADAPGVLKKEAAGVETQLLEPVQQLDPRPSGPPMDPPVPGPLVPA